MSLPATGIVTIAPRPCTPRISPVPSAREVTARLEVEREQQQAAEERGAEQERRGGRRGDDAVLEDAEVDQRVRRSAGRERRTPRSAATPAAAQDRLGEARDDQRQAGRQQRQPAARPASPRRRPRAGSTRAARTSASSATGRLTKKILPPRRGVEQRAAERRPDRGREQHRDADERHHPPHPVRPRGAGQDRHPDRHHQPAAQPLQRPGTRSASRPTTPDHTAANRRANVATAAMNTRRVPNRSTAHPATRDRRRQRQQIRRRDPLDRRQLRVERDREPLDRDVDDRRVEDRHRGAADHDGRGGEHRTAEVAHTAAHPGASRGRHHAQK